MAYVINVNDVVRVVTQIMIIDFLTVTLSFIFTLSFSMNYYIGFSNLYCLSFLLALGYISFTVVRV